MYVHVHFCFKKPSHSHIMLQASRSDEMFRSLKGTVCMFTQSCRAIHFFVKELLSPPNNSGAPPLWESYLAKMTLQP